jgi:hypothetical protein
VVYMCNEGCVYNPDVVCVVYIYGKKYPMHYQECACHINICVYGTLIAECQDGQTDQQYRDGNL